MTAIANYVMKHYTIFTHGEKGLGTIGNKLSTSGFFYKLWVHLCSVGCQNAADKRKMIIDCEILVSHVCILWHVMH